MVYKMKRVIPLFLILLNASCGDFSQDVEFRRQNKSGAANADGSLGLYAEMGFLPEPGACSKTYSKGYYCDGYTQRNVPLSPASPNPTPETSASTTPPPQAVQLQVVGTFDRSVAVPI